MISGGSCDPEDAENTALIKEIKCILKLKAAILNCNSISLFLLYF